MAVCALAHRGLARRSTVTLLAKSLGLSASVPRTLSGNKLELPVRLLLLGAEAAQVLNRNAMGNAGSVDWFVDFARRRSGPAHGVAPP